MTLSDSDSGSRRASRPTADPETTACLSADDAAGLVAGELDASQRRAAADHLDVCEACRRLVSALAGAEPATDPEGAAELAAPGLQAGEVLGRFTLVRRVGRGSMGEVWAARDGELDREVALKLLRLRPGGLTGEATLRLRREAQAMARLHHRHVVTIYELGTDGDRVFCAMELIDGATLRQWLATPRRWREVIEVACAAGTGVAAAHAAGLVHRDIKPENILIDTGGRAVVSDFGLARLVDLGNDEPPVAGVLAEGSDLRRPGELTATGAVIGTPVYMAPEQLAGQRADVRSDQFSYCVTIYEALFGTRPFGGTSLVELAQDVRRGARRPAQLRGAPAAVLRCLLRGLAVDPEARWPSMAALVEQLRRAARRPRQIRTAALAIGLVLAAVAAVALGMPHASDPIEAERAAADQRISAVWNPAKAQAMATAFAATHAAYADERAAAATRLLDRYRASWLAQRLDAWSATHVRQAQTTESLEHRLACYDRLVDTMNGVVAVLLAPAASDVDRAPQTVHGLESIESCGDVDRLTASSSSPATPAGKAVAAALQALVISQITGHKDDALREAQALIDSATQLGDPQLVAQVRFALGASQMAFGKPAEAAEAFGRAVQEAAATRDHYLVASAWLRLYTVTGGDDLGRPDDADAMEPAVRAAVAQAGDAPLLRAELATALGVVSAARGDFAAARDHFVDARDRYVAALGPDDATVATAESNLGDQDMQLGELDEADRHIERAVAILRAEYGEHHGSLANAEHELAAVDSYRKDWASAERHVRASLSIDLALRRADHPMISRSRLLLAEVLREQRRFVEARAELDQARSSMVRTLPPTHREVIMLEVRYAQLAFAEQHVDEALARVRPAIERLRGAGVPAVAMVYALNELARMTARDHPGDAVPIYDEALRFHLQRESRALAEDLELLTGIGNASLAARRPAAALGWFARLPEAATRLAELRAQLERAPHR